MEELAKIVKKKYNDFDITSQHLGQILRGNNITRKRTRHEHYPKERYGKPTNQTKELITFYKEVRKYSLSKIICLDETSIRPSMYPAYSKCPLGKRCIIKTDDNAVFTKYSLVVGITNKKCLGYSLYQKGAVNSERFDEFIKEICKNVKNKLIILDNGQIHKKESTKKIIKDSGNFLLYIIIRL